MKKILILTNYYPPCNGTATNRPYSFATNFKKYGFEVVVVTRQWTGNESTWDDILRPNNTPSEVKDVEGIEVHYRSYPGYKYPAKLLSPINTVVKHLKGDYNFELNYLMFKDYIDSLVAKEKFDYILATTPPLTVLKTASLIAEKHNIPLIADIRDFENDVVLAREPKLNFLQKLNHRNLVSHLSKWLKPAKLAMTVSPYVTSYIKEKTGANVITVTNGFHTNVLEVNEEKYQDCFAITVTGTLYDWSNLEAMLESFRLVFERHPEARIRFNCIGTKAIPHVADRISAVIPEKNLVITHRVPYKEAITIASKSHVLLLVGFDSMVGIYTTKLFEYLGLRRNIIQIPTDNNVIEEILNDTKGGRSPQSPEEAYNIIMEWYEEWERTGDIAYHGDMEKIKLFSRDNLFKKMLHALGEGDKVIM